MTQLSATTLTTILLVLSGALLLASLSFLPTSLPVWVGAKVLYGIGVVLFLIGV